ncbi:hypothetical protein PoB_003951400 [Plakobranchus ocellatus]|uniref:Uncharacterized protein n=1 Tax=Plakobranchus ocellatus TaxID=259542 RepID=A0AAV4AZ08_9GAST|nr:hypothetical protein PoB_003951400 [Plakobranchus ocellatus]
MESESDLQAICSKVCAWGKDDDFHFHWLGKQSTFRTRTWKTFGLRKDQEGEERHSLVGHFNSVFNKDARDSLSAALINVGSVERKLPIPGVVGEAQNPHDHSSKYHVKVVRGGNTVSIQVCVKAFLYTYDETLAKKKNLMMWSR